MQEQSTPKVTWRAGMTRSLTAEEIVARIPDPEAKQQLRDELGEIRTAMRGWSGVARLYALDDGAPGVRSYADAVMRYAALVERAATLLVD